MNDVNTAAADATNATDFLNRLLEVDRALELAEMISGIAHELSQPLAAMATFSQAGARMLDRPDPLTGRSLGVFREISQEALQAGARLQGLRRLFEPGPPLQIRSRMAELVAEMTTVLNVLAGDVGAALKIQIADELPEVFIERLKIQRVLLALVRNAVDASAAIRGQRVIRIELVAERYSVETSVTDLGAGVGADMLMHMFRPFSTTKPSGRGLGLSSCRAIVESHGGTIGFDNIATGGVRFWFKLPFAS